MVPGRVEVVATGLVDVVATGLVVTVPATVVVVVAAAAAAASVNIAEMVPSEGGAIFIDAGKKAIVIRISGVNLIDDGSVVIVGLVCATVLQYAYRMVAV